MSSMQTSGSFSDHLHTRIQNKEAVIGIIGLGYVGLPLARAFTISDFKVLGFDVDSDKVNKLSVGKSYIKQISDETIKGMAAKGFQATTQFERLAEADAILICVPTPLTIAREPDLTYVLKSAEQIAKTLRSGQLVVLESTTYPTTTRVDVLPILERTGLRPGLDFFVAFSPEREDPGNVSHSVQNIPKVVGGLCERSRDVACALYGAIVPKVVPVTSPEVAEACKILENTYRAVNIALVNELKVLYDRMGIDVWEVIDAAKTKPFGYQAFYPGPGLGGHCIPIDPFYLTWVARKYGTTTRFIELAGEINASMPAYVVSRLADALNSFSKPVRGSRVVILGMAYKKDVDDARESPGFELMELLLNKGAIVTYNDPHIPVLPSVRQHPRLKMQSSELTPEFLGAQDCVLIATDHSSYDYNLIVRHSKLVLDTRNATKAVAENRDRIVKA